MKRQLHKRVLGMLIKNPDTRNSDAELQRQILLKYYGIDNTKVSHYEIVTNNKLPQIESIGRVRRKCQELYPELRADDNVQAMREMKEEDYVQYAMSIH